MKNLPIELINRILIFRPTHPIALIVKEFFIDIQKPKRYILCSRNNKTTYWFMNLYFGNDRIGRICSNTENFRNSLYKHSLKKVYCNFKFSNKFIEQIKKIK